LPVCILGLKTAGAFRIYGGSKQIALFTNWRADFASLSGRYGSMQDYQG